MAVDVGSLQWTADLDTSGFNRKVDRAEGRMENLESQAQETGSSISDAGEKMQDFGSKLSGTVTAGITAAAAGLATAANKAANFGDRLELASAQSGIGEERLQQFTQVAQRVSGVGFEKVQDGLKELALRSQEALQNGGEAKEAFDQLGISMSELESMSPEETLSRVQQEMRGMTERQRALATEQLFGGEAGEKFAEMMGLSADELSRLRSESQGNILSPEQVDVLDRMGEAFNSLMADVRGTINVIGVELAPLMTGTVIPVIRRTVQGIRSLAQWFGNLSPTVQKLVGAFAAALAAIGPIIAAIGTVMTILPALTSSFALLGGLIGGAVVGALTLLIANWESVKAAFQEGGIFGPIVQGIQDMIDAVMESEVLEDIINGLKEVMNQSIGVMIELWDLLKTAIKTAVDRIRTVVTTVWDFIGGFLVDSFRIAWNQVVKVLGTALGFIEGAIQAFKGVITGDWEKIWKGIEKMAANAWNAILATVASGVRQLGNALSSALSTFGMDEWAEDLKTSAENAASSLEDAGMKAGANIKEGVSSEGEKSGTDYIKKLTESMTSSENQERAKNSGKIIGAKIKEGVQEAEPADLEELDTGGMNVPDQPVPMGGGGGGEAGGDNQGQTLAQGTAQAAANLPLISATAEEIQQKFKGAAQASRLLREGLRKLSGLGTKAMTTLFKSVGKGLGKVIAGTQKVRDIGKTLLKKIASFMKQIASAMISIGSAMALVPGFQGNAALYIAGGTALMAAASALSASISDSGSGEGGGSGGGQTAVGLQSGGVTTGEGLAMLHENEVVRDKKVDDEMFQNAQRQRRPEPPETETRISGEDIIISTNEAQRRNAIAGINK